MENHCSPQDMATESTLQRLSIAELDAIGKVGAGVCDSSRDLMRDMHNVDNHVSGSVERLGLYNVSATERSGDKTQSVVASESHRTQNSVEVESHRTQDAINGSERYLYAGMSQNARDILLQASSNTAAIQSSLCNDTKDILLQAASNTDKVMSQNANQFKDVLLQAAQNAKEQAVQSTLNAKDAIIAATSNFKDMVILGEKNTAAIQLEAYRHKEELARQIAECCCEQKILACEARELAVKNSCDTQALVRELDTTRIRDELARAREELVALRVRATLLPPLVGSVGL